MIHIAMICDEKYVMPTCVALASIRYHIKNESIYYIHIIADRLTSSSISMLKQFEQENLFIHVIHADNDKYDAYIKKGFPVSVAALYKFDLPEIFPDIDKILYIDGDILVQQDLSDLYAIEIQEVYAGVVKDQRALTLKGNVFERLGIQHSAYFNSGVLLLNLQKMRTDSIQEKLIAYRTTGINYYMDQDAFNVVFGECVLYLSFYNNFQLTCWRHGDVQSFAEYYELPHCEDKYEYFDSAVIIHFTADKPWEFFDGHLSERWLQYYFLTPFCNQELERKSIKTLRLPAEEIHKRYQNRLPNFTNRVLEKPFISIILPVYNGEKFLERALNSIKWQSLINYEVICVDDGSTDQSLYLLQQYALQDDRVRIIEQSNQYAGAARNAAIAIAQGEYIVFLDADDELVPNALECFCLKAFATKADYIIARCLNFEANKLVSTSLDTSYLPKDVDVFAGKDFPDTILLITHGGPNGKCIKRQFISDHDLRFLVIPRSEDFYFIHLALCLAERITIIDRALYIYHIDNTFSLENTKDKTPTIFWNAVQVMKQKMIDLNIFEYFKKAFIFSNMIRFAHNLNKMKSGYGFKAVADVLIHEASQEFEFMQHDSDYYKGIHCYPLLYEIAGFTTGEDYLFAQWKKQTDIEKYLQARLNGISSARAKVVSKKNTNLLKKIYSYLYRMLLATLRTLKREGVIAVFMKGRNEVKRMLHKYVAGTKNANKSADMQ